MYNQNAEENAMARMFIHFNETRRWRFHKHL